MSTPRPHLAASAATLPSHPAEHPADPRYVVGRAPAGERRQRRARPTRRRGRRAGRDRSLTYVRGSAGYRAGMGDAFDLAAYRRRSTEGPCFVCAFLAGHPDYRHHIVYEDGEHIAFLSRYPTLPGYCLVAPKEHIEDWVHDMDLDRFLRFQGVVHGVARAVAAAVPTE